MRFKTEVLFTGVLGGVLVGALLLAVIGAGGLTAPVPAQASSQGSAGAVLR